MSDLSEFDRLAEERWERGIREIRGGDSRRPFDGDPVAEGIEECLDLRNYAIEAERQELIGGREARSIRWAAQMAFNFLSDADAPS